MNNIQNILNEIYAVDPALKNYEEELINIIQEIINKRPDTKFDESFARELRTEVLKRAKELNLTQAQIKPEAISFLARMPRWSYAVAGATLMAVVILPFTMHLGGSKSTNDIATSLNSGVSKLASNAFGTLSSNESVNDTFGEQAQGLGGSNLAVADDVVAINEGNRADVKEESAIEPMLSAPIGLGGGGGIGSKMIMPNPFSFEYKYIGEDMVLGESSAEVYRRVVNKSSAGIGSLIGSMDFGLLNLGALDNLGLQTLNLSQDKEFGLNLNFNAEEGSFSIHKNWQMWPNPQQDCRTEECYQSTRLQANDVPGDSTIIKLANDFVAEMGVDVSMYGEPMIQDNWRKELERYGDSRDVWVPEEIQVIYPLIIDGQTVYDYGGQPSGLTVNVDVRNKRGSGLYNLFPYNYESSDYKMVNDFNRILKLAERGGDRPVYYYEEGEQIVLELGTPEKVLMQYHKYDQATGRSNALFLPALNFPIINKEDAKYYNGQEAVLIPLAEDIVKEWEERYQEMEDNGPVPMPLLRDAADSVVEPMIEPMILEEDNE